MPEFNAGFCATHFTGRINTVESLGSHRDDGMWSGACLPMLRMITLSPSSRSKSKKVTIKQVEKRKCLILGSVFTLTKSKWSQFVHPKRR